MIVDPSTGLSQLPSPKFLAQVAAEDGIITEDLEGRRVNLEEILEKAEYFKEH